MMRKRQRICGETSNQAAAAAAAPEGVDYISSLPHELMHHILSFLPFEYYIILGTVSTGWKELLDGAPVLLLDEKKIASKIARKLCDEFHKLRPNLHEQLDPRYIQRQSRKRFAALVNRVVASRSDLKIKYMLLSFHYEPRTESSFFIHNWLHFVMTKDIEKLELNIAQESQAHYCRGELELLSLRRAPYIEVPDQPFNPEYTSFILKFCKLKASRFGAFANLKVLYLSDVRLLDDSIGQVLSKFRILEDLKMKRCSVPEKFFVCNQDMKLKHLKLINCVTHQWAVYVIDISAPQLIILKFKGINLLSSTIRNATNLIDCSINMDVNFTEPPQGNLLALFMLSIRHCRTLTLDTWCIQVIPLLEYELSQQLKGSFINLKKLTLKFGCFKRELPGIILLLEICPVLENLILELSDRAEDLEFLDEIVPDLYNYHGGTYLDNETQVIPCLQNRLKELQIYWFTGLKYELKLIGFLLQKALVLENLVICNDWSMSNGLEERIWSLLKLQLQSPMQKFQNLPRGSYGVQVSLNHVKFPTAENCEACLC